MPPAKKKVEDPKQSEAAKAEKVKAESAKQALLKAFNAFDLNGDGVVSEEELIRILMRPTEEGTSMDKETAKAMINSFESYDRNGDGVLSIDEFSTALSAAASVVSPPKK